MIDLGADTTSAWSKACAALEEDVMSQEANSSHNNVTSNGPLGVWAYDCTMLNCQLFNTSYGVTFNYTNGEQDITVGAPHRQSDEPVKTLYLVYGPNITLGPVAPINTVYCSDQGETTYPAAGSTPCSIFDEQVVQTLAYQATMEAFINLISRNIAFDVQIQNSSILTTTLLNTKQLAFMSDSSVEAETAYYRSLNGSTEYFLQARLANSSFASLSGMPAAGYVPPSQSLSSAIEQMFQNYVVSLMNEGSLRLVKLIQSIYWIFI